MNTLTVAYTQHRGNTPQQQDALLINGQVLQSNNLPTHSISIEASPLNPTLCAIADGLAVSPAAAKASKLALTALLQCARNQPSWLKSSLITAKHIRQVQSDLADRLGTYRASAGASTTIAAVQLIPQATGWLGVALNVGDTRVYKIDNHGAPQQLSKDHSLLQAMIESGEIAASEANVYGSIYQSLAHCLIASHDESEFNIHVCHFDLGEGERILICSDGLHEQLGEAYLWGHYDARLTAANQVQLWRNLLLAIGAPDNLSIVLLQV